MKVRILQDICDHVRVYAPGVVVDLPEAQSDRWVEKGWAEPVIEDHPETATLEGGEEHAVLPRGRRRRPV
jgi:hypothetical protein